MRPEKNSFPNTVWSVENPVEISTNIFYMQKLNICIIFPQDPQDFKILKALEKTRLKSLPAANYICLTGYITFLQENILEVKYLTVRFIDNKSG